MFSNVQPFSIFPLVSAIICAFIIIYTIIKGEKSLKLLSFVLVMACSFIWPLGQFLEYTTCDVNLVLLFSKITHTGVAYLGVFCFLFSLYYTESTFVNMYKKVIPAFFIIPTIIVIALITNEFHWLFFKVYPDPHSILKRSVELGPFYWIESAYSYLFAGIAIIIIIRSAFRNTGRIRKQRITIVLVMLIPLALSLLFTLLSAVNNWKTSALDFTPTSFSLSCLFIFLATFRYNFLDIIPVALKIIFDRIEHATVVFNQNNRLVKYNSAFNKEFRFCIDTISHINTTEKFSCYLRKSIVGGDTVNVLLNSISENTIDTKGEICFIADKTGDVNIFEVSVQSIFSPSRNFLGKIISFNDITRHKTLLEEVNQKNNQLTAMNEKLIELNKQLNENIKLSEQLAIANERNRIAGELHDSLGHSLILLIMLMKSGKIECDVNSYNTKEKLTKGINIAEDSFRELRRVLKGLLSDNIKNRNIIFNLENLFDDFRYLGIKINFSVIGKEHFNNSDKTLKITDTVYNLCKEALTNSIRHGKATTVNIILKYTSGNISLYIFDNGDGCKEIIEGFGLSGMKERVKSINGTIVFGSDGESGFNIRAELPVGGKNDKSIDCG